MFANTKVAGALGAILFALFFAAIVVYSISNGIVGLPF